MADITVNGKQLQIILSLAEADSNEEVATRTFTVDLPSGDTGQAVKTRAQAFKETYMQNFANYPPAGASGGSGSLIQITGWRDDDLQENALKCIGMQINYIDKTTIAFDI